MRHWRYPIWHYLVLIARTHSKLLWNLCEPRLLKTRVKQQINTPVSYIAEKLKTNLPKIKQNIINSSKTHQFEMIKSNRRLQFYPSFKTVRSISIRKKFFLWRCKFEIPNLNTLNNADKILFLFNNIDHFICKKLGYFTFEAFHQCNYYYYYYYCFFFPLYVYLKCNTIYVNNSFK